jgi:histidine phosphotransferase ChpT
MIDTSDAEMLARGLFTSERTSLAWNAPAVLLPKNKVKLILNLCLIAATAIPRGGVIEVMVSGEGEEAQITVSAKAANAKLANQLPPLLAGTPEHAPSTPQDVQAYYAGLIARAARMALSITAGTEIVTIEAAPQLAEATAEDAAL